MVARCLLVVSVPAPVLVHDVVNVCVRAVTAVATRTGLTLTVHIYQVRLMVYNLLLQVWTLVHVQLSL